MIEKLEKLGNSISQFFKFKTIEKEESEKWLEKTQRKLKPFIMQKNRLRRKIQKLPSCSCRQDYIKIRVFDHK
jgi:hypothetical protein